MASVFAETVDRSRHADQSIVSDGRFVHKDGTPYPGQ